MGHNCSNSEFKYLGSVLDESGSEDAKCHRKATSTIKSLVNARGLHLECMRDCSCLFCCMAVRMIRRGLGLGL